MAEEDGALEGEYSFSSANARLRRGKRSKSRSIGTKQKLSPETSSLIEQSLSATSSTILLNGVRAGEDSCSYSKSNSIKTSTSTTNEAGMDLPSESTKESVTDFLNEAYVEHLPMTMNASDEDENIIEAARYTSATTNSNNATNYIDLSEVRITNTRKPWEKEIMTKSSHSRSSRNKSGSRSRRIRRRRSGGGSRNGSRHSERSVSIGSRNISCSSHCSSAHTMASSLDTTDSDLDSLESNEDDSDSYYDLLSDNDDDDHFQHRDQQAYLKYRQYLSSSDDEDEDIGEYDDVWREQSDYDQRKSANKLGAPPSLSYSYRYSAAAEELYNEAAATLESTEPIEAQQSQPITAQTMKLDADTTTNQLSPTVESAINKIYPPSLPQQQELTPGSEEEYTLSPPKENSLEDDTMHTDGLISFHDPPKILHLDEQQLQDQEINSERNRNDDKGENFSDPNDQSNRVLNLHSPTAGRQVFWASELSRQYSHESEELHSSGMHLILNSSDDNNDDSNDFSEVWDESDTDVIEPVTNHSEHITGSSLSSTSLQTMRSSQRCQLSDREVEIEPSLISQNLKRSQSNFSSSSNSDSSEVKPPPPDFEDEDDRNDDIPIQTTIKATPAEIISGVVSQTPFQASISTSSLNNPEDVQSDSNGGVSLDTDEVNTSPLEEYSISARSNYQNEQQTNKTQISHQEVDSVSIGKQIGGSKVKGKSKSDHAVGEKSQLSGEQEPEIGAGLRSPLLIPRNDEHESLEVLSHMDVSETYHNILGPYHNLKQSTTRSETPVSKNYASSSDDYSNCLMEYSISNCPADNLQPITNATTIPSRRQPEKSSSLTPFIRKRRCIVRGLGSFLVLLFCGMALYFFVWFDIDSNDRVMNAPIQLDPIFVTDP